MAVHFPHNRSHKGERLTFIQQAVKSPWELGSVLEAEGTREEPGRFHPLEREQHSGRPDRGRACPAVGGGGHCQEASEAGNEREGVSSGVGQVPRDTCLGRTKGYIHGA